MAEQIVKISNGKATWIYEDSLADLLQEGPSKISRASYVEPEGTDWWATMTDGTRLGPYKFREDALKAERAYLEEKMFK